MPTTSTCGYCILSLSPHLERNSQGCIQEIDSRRAYLAANLQGMMTIFVVRRVRATAMGLAPARSVLG
jgi:hypothetical protein